ncbi:Multidrug resistance ABC transporter ATP-binding and permease protein [Planctomycetes bacterium Poly30]|uniref:Multidrug resistance ABC transporter ATP-binding and permease protein n=1 Tax=Saltatorellus ferox TaxID=2528018 RepID=A0A518EQ68_9BACT|nr:Multidrug resistance ABC transporter ATP-binding and permease protein [Planctomycetes bacterium Poly30]
MSEESPPPPSTEEATVSFGRLYGLARPHLTLILTATGLMLVMSLIGLAVPKLAGDVVDTALESATRSELRSVVAFLIGLFALMGFLGFIEFYLLGLAGARLLRDLRRSLFERLVGLSPGFFDQRRVGELLSRLGSDLTVVQASITEQIPSGIQALLRFVGTLIVLFVLQTRLTLVALLIVPPVVIIALVVGIRLEKLSKKERDATADTSSLAEESLAGIRTVQASGAEPRTLQRYGDRLADLLGVQVRNARLQSAFAGVMTFAGFTSFALVLGYGGELMLDKKLTAGELTSFLLYTFSIAMTVGQLGSLYAGYKRLKGASARLFELLDTKSSVVDPEGAEPFTATSGAISIDSVVFEYEEGARALDGVSIEVEPGSMIALVGPSGSGKSTLLSLLLRFYDPTSGEVRVDGRELRTIRIEDLRRAMGLVPQEVFLFSGTVADNLRLGRPDASDSEVEDALKAAGALDFVRALAEGIETEVGERGMRLSGGQRQRLAIARAFLEDPTILLLDEATSSLDPDSEALVQEALQRLFDGRTTIVIAHRLATARRADRIYVLDGGAVTASGTHSELIEASELYRRYWTLQSLGALEGESGASE